MGFRFHRRLNLGSGLGLNLGKSGSSVSGRTFFGSVGTRGFSVRSGVPGFSYRKSFGRGGAGLVVGLVVVVAALVVNLIVLLVGLGVNLLLVLVQVCWVLAVAAVNLLLWVTLTTADFIGYMIGRSRLAEASGSSSDCPPPPTTTPHEVLPVLPIHGLPGSSPPPGRRG
jgi:fatty acid desaturase